jgi:hypothetical protein
VTVPQKKILNLVAIGSVPACTLTNENTGIFSGWRMQGAGQWEFSGSGTPPDGTYFASNRIEVRASPGTASTPWRATLISGLAPEEGRVFIEGHPTIVPFFEDVLIVAGEVTLKGTGGAATLTGAVLASGGQAVDVEPEVKIEGSVNLIGNILTGGEIEVRGTATVTYNVATRTRLLGPLRVLSWSTVSQ